VPHVFPRVLLVSHEPLSASRANGKTLRALFGEWPRECLRQLYLTPLEPEDSRWCRYWRVSEADLVKRVLTAGLRGHGGEVEADNDAERRQTVDTARRQVRARLNCALTQKIRESLWRRLGRPSERLLCWIKEFDPQLVYLLGGGSRFSFRLANEVASGAGAPLIIHLTDNYYINIATSTGKRSVTPLADWVSPIMRRAAGRVAICDEMARELAHHFECPFEVFLNCVDNSDIGTSPEEKHTPLVLTYVGGLHLDRWRSLIQIGETLDRLSERHGIEAVLRVYAHPSDCRLYSRLLVGTRVCLVGSLQPDAVQPVLRQANVLVHVESFETFPRRATWLAMSTKIPEYLAAGRAMFAVGPAEAASLRYLESNHVALVATSPDLSAVAAGLKVLLEDEDLRASYGARAAQLAAARHSARKEQLRFRRFLDQLANAPTGRHTRTTH